MRGGLRRLRDRYATHRLDRGHRARTVVTKPRYNHGENLAAPVFRQRPQEDRDDLGVLVRFGDRLEGESVINDVQLAVCWDHEDAGWFDLHPRRYPRHRHCCLGPQHLVEYRRRTSNMVHKDNGGPKVVR